MEKTDYSFNSTIFQERLKAAMEKKHYRNADLARITGISAATIGNYINGHRTPRGFADIVPVAKALDVSLDYLAGVIGPDKQDDKKPSGLFRPQNYYEAVKMINLLLDAFKSETDLKQLQIDLTTCIGVVTLKLNNNTLHKFMMQQDELYRMAGGSLSPRAFSIALDDLNDKMKNTPINIEDVFPF